VTDGAGDGSQAPRPEGDGPTAEQYAERARRADRATRGALAAVLALEGLVVLLVPRALAFTSAGLGGTKTVVLIGIAVLLVAGAAVTRRSFGVAVGTVLQAVFLLTGILLPVLFVLAALFAAVWLRLLFLRRDLVGTPGGVRMLVS
jgi:hypothetical protein